MKEQELAIVIRVSHVLAVPSFYEGYGIAYVEGMAFGLPALATTAGAAGEIITHGKDGFLISPGDSLALSRHLESLNNERDMLIRMSLDAVQRFRHHPIWESTCETIVNYLLSQLSPRR